MGDKFTEIAADRPGYFSCYIGKLIMLVDDSNVPMCYRNRPARVMYQTDNFLVVAFDECEGWAFQVHEISNVRVLKDVECSEQEKIIICGVLDCNRVASETINVTQAMSDNDMLEQIVVPIFVCSECYKTLLERHSMENVTHSLVIESDKLLELEITK